MRWYNHVGAAVLVLFLVSGSPLPAQGPVEPGDSFESTAEKAAPDRKTPRWLRRPSCTTPADQLLYAGRLETEGRLRRARRAYDDLVREWHAAPEASEAQFKLAGVLEQSRKWQAAFDEYQYLLDQFTAGYPHEAVLERQFRIAHAVMTDRHFKLLGMPGFTTPEAALPLFEKIVKNAPTSATAAEAQYLIGDIHDQRDDLEDAIDAFLHLRNRYPDSSYVAEADFRRALCLYRLFLKRPREEETCREALSNLSLFIRDYPAHPRVREAQQRLDELKESLAGMYYERAQFYERGAHRKPGAALIAYQDFIRNFPGSPLALDAARRINELKPVVEALHNVETNKP
ncbi:MAG: hypothetical protein A2269_08870 [Lentisphaerae bacterium RIFOXYA12_FULL_60_10]|nr:MAG: hypothetical protein A2269_08870 [Lentisphaerae bacterium RIFOXYA12_FULL_60_10]